MMHHASACSFHKQDGATKGDSTPHDNKVDGYNKFHKVLIKNVGNGVVEIMCGDCSASMTLKLAKPDSVTKVIDAEILRMYAAMHYRARPVRILLGGKYWRELYARDDNEFASNGVLLYKGIPVSPALPTQQVSILVEMKS